MRILLYEFITGGGWHLFDPHQPPGGSLLAEGTAMRDALASDLADTVGVEVALLHDPRLAKPFFGGSHRFLLHEVASADEHLPVLLAAAAGADATILIAPEFDGHLLDLARALEQAGAALLSPGSQFIQIASDKHRTATRLAAAGVPVPQGYLLNKLHEQEKHSPPLPYPAVIKPNDGAGSQGVQLVRQPSDISLVQQDLTATWRWETFSPGQAASVAVLSGPTPIPCPACWQDLTDDGKFTYLGGRRLEDRRLAGRAQSLAMRAMAALPPTVGYVGIDLILGPPDDGSADVVIEVNPRLTTSYVGLRRLTSENLAQAIIAIAQGKATELSWIEGEIQFESDGTCH